MTSQGSGRWVGSCERKPEAGKPAARQPGSRKREAGSPAARKREAERRQPRSPEAGAEAGSRSRARFALRTDRRQSIFRRDRPERATVQLPALAPQDRLRPASPTVPPRPPAESGTGWHHPVTAARRPARPSETRSCEVTIAQARSTTSRRTRAPTRPPEARAGRGLRASHPRRPGPTPRGRQAGLTKAAPGRAFRHPPGVASQIATRRALRRAGPGARRARQGRVARSSSSSAEW